MSINPDVNSPEASEQAPQPRRLRRFNKRMFFFFGPPQLGDTGQPAPAVDRDPICPRCGTRESQHTIFRDAAKSFAQCPVDPHETAPPN